MMQRRKYAKYTRLKQVDWEYNIYLHLRLEEKEHKLFVKSLQLFLVDNESGKIKSHTHLILFI